MKPLLACLLAVLLASSIFGFNEAKLPQDSRTLKVSLKSKGYYDQLELRVVESSYVAEIRHSGKVLGKVKGKLSLEQFRELYSEAKALTGAAKEEPSIELALNGEATNSPKLSSFIAKVNQRLLLESGFK